MHDLPGARPDRRGGSDGRRLRRVRGAVDRRGRGAGDRGAARARAAPRGRPDRPPLSDLLALQDAARLPRRRRLVHLRRRDPPAAAGRERDRRVDAELLLEADGRLAAQHGRLEHLAQALLRPAAALLPVRVRPSERDRLARGARGAGDGRPRRAPGAAPAVDRRRVDPLRAVRPRGAADPGGRRRLARRRDRPVLDARLAEPGAEAGRLCDRRVGGPLRRRPARPRLLGAVVPGGLGLREPRADPALVLLDVVHVGDARGPVALRARARLRAGPGRDRQGDAQVHGQRDRGERGDRADGRRRHALDLLRAGAEPERELRLRAGERGQAAAS